MAAAKYPSKVKTDKDKLFACYSLCHQMVEEHNRQGAIARSNPEKYIKSGKWHLFANRPVKEGGNAFWNAMSPLLRERAALRLSIRRAVYDDKTWKAMSEEEQDAVAESLWGNRKVEGVKPTLASCPNLDAVKLIKLDDVKKTAILDPYEDFDTDYTVVDEGTDLTLSDTRITIDTMQRNRASYVRRDMGAGHFGNFEWKVALSAGAMDNPSDLGAIAATTNYFNIDDCKEYSEGFVIQYWRQGAFAYRTILKCFEQDDKDTLEVFAADDYWYTLERNGATGTLKVYDDGEDRTNLVTGGDLSITCTATTYRYVAWISRDEDSVSPTNVASGYWENLDLQEAVPGWTGKIAGVTNPARIMDVAKAKIATVKEVA